MTKLTQAQRDLLEAASTQPDGAIEATPETKRAAATLIKRGMMISISTADGPGRLLITTQGRDALAPAIPPPLVSTAVAGPKGKLGMLVELLRRDEGATVDDLTAATGWQKHSVRGAISGTVKKKLGLSVTSTPSEAGRIYRIAAEATA